jgi:exopolyphosphatase/pppGpp-phosphohydrolase
MSTSCAGRFRCMRLASRWRIAEFHKHGAYILGHADMPGFSKRDQARLALLVLGQRGKLQKLAAMPAGDPELAPGASVCAGGTAASCAR